MEDVFKGDEAAGIWSQMSQVRRCFELFWVLELELADVAVEVDESFEISSVFLWFFQIFSDVMTCNFVN